MNLKIITDSSSDYTQDEAQKLGITVLPLTLNYGNKSYRDGIDITKDEFYDLLINQHQYPKTSQPTADTFEKIFSEAKVANETVLVLLIANSLSGSYANACLAKEKVQYENIFVVDSCTTIAGLQILVEHALKLSKEGKDIHEIVDSLNQLKKRIVVVAIMNTLEYLVKGGRLSSAEGLIGNLLNLKPTIKFKEDGSIDVIGKSFGRIRANIHITKFFKANPADENYPIYYYYSYNQSNLMNLMEKLKKENLYREGKIVNLSPVVGCHIGDNAYALIYVRKENEAK